MALHRALLPLFAALSLAACVGELDTGAVDTEGFTTLVSADWSLPAGAEGYACILYTVPADTYVVAFDPIIPNGTHHSVLASIDDNDESAPHYPDGFYLGSGHLTDLGPATWCTGFTSGSHLLYGSGVGTVGAALPTGIAVELAAGQQVILNLHLYNATDARLDGRSGVRVRAVDRAQVEHVAEAQLMGPIVLNIPPRVVDHRVTGTCTLAGEPIHAIAITPHMHTRGVHLKTEVRRGATMSTVFDEDYDFDNQIATALNPVVDLQPGDQVVTTCTFDNPGDTMIGFGESTTDEMCFSGVMYWPAQGKRTFCDDALGL